MEDILVFPAGSGEAVFFAEQKLKQYGVPFVDHPTPEVTHLLLNVPTKDVPVALLERLPEGLAVVGGNLTQQELSGYRKIDLLRNDEYLAKNAAITAECALRVAAAEMKTVFSGSSALVIGWGRIGKCLAALLKNTGCEVTVAARKVSDRAILAALGYRVIDPADFGPLTGFGVIFNTVPELMLTENQLSLYPGTIKIDLASRQGLIGTDVIWARGLPGLYAPQSSGTLIAETFLKEVTV